MNRIDRTFKELRRAKKRAFIAYIAAGDPDIATTKKLVVALERSGVDMIELGIPFSDPVADGPVIQAASVRALARGITLQKIFAAARDIRRTTEIPLIFMTYYNPIMQYGVRAFFASCAAAGVDGVIVPDMPIEEAGDAVRFGRQYGIATIFLVAPTSTAERMCEIAERSSGFVYYVSLTGVTGVRAKLPIEVASRVRRLKSMTATPVAVGFGISTAGQAKAVAAAADGVIVGSALVKLVGGGGRIVPRVSRFARSLAAAIHSVRV